MNLRMKTAAAAAVFTLGLAAPAFAAPLFPDVPENHWARDAVATLAAKGIVEGYPDGTFKGDRNATRWEVAMIVARLLGQMEQEHATFATKAELAELQKLVDALRSELDALGARVGTLEDKVENLDLRVSELERITFYGSVDTRITAQSFANDTKTSQDNNDGMGWSYNDAVGSADGLGLDPRLSGLLPVADYRNGVGLTNGTGFSMKAILGMRIRVTDDIDAGAEFAAYTTAGNQLVDALWGVSAPYLCNQFGGGSNNFGNLNNANYTRMVLDNFWVIHNPSGIKLTLGAYSEDNMDNILFAGQKNLGAFGPEYLDRFGFNVSGSHAFEAGVLRWEVLGSRITNYAYDAAGQTANVAYDTDVIGVDVGFEFGGGQVKLNFMRAANEAANGDALRIGGIGGANMDYGMVWNTAMSNLQWVNPEGYQTGALMEMGGAGSTSDNRPIPGWVDWANGGTGVFGPQSMAGYGISANYKWDIGESGNEIYVAGEYAHTEYKSNKDSNYSSDGNAYRIEVGANLLEGDLDLSLAYLAVDPNYDPFVNMNPVVGGTAGMIGNMMGLNNFNRYSAWAVPNINYYADMWSLHDTEVYPHNRQGFRFNGQWRFAERHGLLWAKASFLEQKKSSLYDVRTLSADGNVLGFAPGFMDPVFYGYASASVYGGQSYDSFDANLNPLEDNKGKQNQYGIGASYKWDNPRLKLDLGYEHNDFKRKTSLDVFDGGSQNHVKLNTENIHIGLGWEATDQLALRIGCDMVNMNGHWDPSGAYNQFAASVNSVDFKNMDVQQTIPFIGFDYDISANTQWNMDFRYYDTKDKVDASTYADYTGGHVQTINDTTNGYTNHPFSWYGWQVTTQFKVKF
ncbi:S-layer homology domain-containing protein [bacterium]|nr:S-layer homology domain-containing protein [bacterium]